MTPEEEQFELVKTIVNLCEAYIICYRFEKKDLLATLSETIYENAQALLDFCIVGEYPDVTPSTM